MTSVRDGIEQAVLVSIGAAAITRERAEAAVAELVRRGQIGGDEGKRAVDRLMETVRGAGAGGAGAGTGEGASSGIVDRLEGGVQGVLREVGVVTRADVEDLRLRLAELEHRIGLLEGAGDAPPPAQGEGDAAEG